MPTALDDVLIDVPGGVLVTVRSGTAVAHSIVSNNALTLTGGTLNLGGGTIQVNNTFTVNGGALQSAVVNAGAGGQGITAGTSTSSQLIGTTVNADLTLAATSARLRVSGNLTLNGTAHLSGSDAYLLFEGINTVNAGTFIFEGTGSAKDIGFWGNSTLTLQPGVVVHGGNGRMGQHRFVGGTGQTTNRGTISADVPGQAISIDPSNGTFINDGGTLEAKNGSALSVKALTGNVGNATLTDSGSSLAIDGAGYTVNSNLSAPAGTTLSLSGTWTNPADTTVSGNGATLNIGGGTAGANAWSNAGTISATSSTVNLGGSFTKAGLGTLVRVGGAVNVTGTLDNTGSTLTLNSASGSWNLAGGTINAGTLTFADGQTLSIDGNTNNHLTGGVTVNGDLVLSTTSARLRVSGGLTLNGTAHLSGSDAYFLFEGPNTVTAGTFVFEGGGSPKDIGFWGNSTVAFEPGVVIHGGNGRIGQHRFVGGTGQVTNRGTITADVPGQTITISPSNGTFANQGTLNALNGGTLDAQGLTGNLNSVALADANSRLSVSGANYTVNSNVSAPAGTTLSLSGTWTSAVDTTVSGNGATLNIGGGTSGSDAWSNAGTLSATNSTVNLGGSFTTAAIGTLLRNGGTVNLTGTLDNTSSTLTLNTTSGSWNLAGGTINAGTLTLSNGQTLSIDGNTNNRLTGGVTVNGDLTLSTTSARLRVSGGLALNGTAHISGSDAYFLFEGPNTVTAGTFLFEGTGSTKDIGFWGNSTLTLLPGVVIRGGNGRIGQHRFVGGTGQTTNRGTISADVAGQTITIDPSNGTFTNDGGTPEAKNGGSLDVRQLAGNLGSASVTGAGSQLSLSGTNWVNNLPLNAPTGTTLTLAGGWSNTGALNVTGGTLNLGGTFTTAGMGSLARTGGTVNVTGTLDNTGSTLTLNNASGSWNLAGGTINAGTLTLADGQTLSIDGNTNNRLTGGVTVNGDLTLSATSARLRVSGGLTLNGTAHLSGSDAYLLFEGPNTVNAGTFVFEGGGSAKDIGFWGNSTLMLQPGVVVHGGNGRIGQHRFVGGTGQVTNRGLISADVSGQSLTIDVSNGTFLNDGGTVEAINGATLALNDMQPNGGTVRVGDVGNLINVTGDFVQASGSTVLGGGTIDPTGAFNIQGGTVTGSGTIKSNVTNGGAVRVGGTGSPGTLSVEGTYTQSPLGSLDVEVGGTTSGTQFDRLAVTAAASLAGTLNLATLNGYLPPDGATFTVISSATRSGNFDAVNGTSAGGGRSFAVTYSATGVTLVGQTSDTSGPAVVSSTPSALTNQAVSSMRLNFDEPVNTASFTPADVLLTTPSGVVPTANITVTPVGSTLSQYASSVIAFSSQFSASSWSAAQALGTPNTNTYGDIATAWAPSSRNGTTESITVGFGTPVNASGVSVRETSGNGFVTRIEVRDTDGVFHEVWSGTDPSQPGAPVDYAVTFPTTSYRVDAVRVTVDTNHDTGSFEEIDAIRLDGTTTPAGGGLVTTFDVSFPTQTADGSYALTVGPNVTDVAGNPMASPYTAAFAIDRTGPRVVAAAPAGDVNPPIGTFDVTFSTPIEPGSFTTADAKLVRPDSSSVNANSVTKISDTVYRLVFGSQSAPGTYTLQVGPAVFDVAGNPMDQDADGSNGEPTDDRFTSPVTIRAVDLQVSGLTVEAAPALQSGANVTVRWNDVNSGNGATGGSWSDRVVVVKTSATPNVTVANATVFYNAGTEGPIAGNGGSKARSYTFRLPDGLDGAGTFRVTVTADADGAGVIPESNAAGTAETNNSAETTVTSTRAPYPDLEIRNLVVTPATLVSGSVVTINWDTFNSGDGPAARSFFDRVSVRNLDRPGDAPLVNSDVFYDATAQGAIAALTGKSRQFTFTLPNGPVSVGNLQFTVTSDIYTQVFEFNTAGTAETNNARSLTRGSTLSAYPDLRVEGLAVTPPSPHSGQMLTINWSDVNRGDGAVDRAFYDRVTVQNLDRPSDPFLTNTIFSYDPGAPGNSPIAPAGGSISRQATVALPNGPAGAGRIQVQVQTDAGSQVFEFFPAIDADANNTATADVVSSLSDYPDLTVTGITGPASGRGGQSVPVSWTVKNQGSAATAVGWTEQVFLSTDNVIGNDVLLATFTYAGPLSSNQSVTRTEAVTLPSFGTGDRWLVVKVDSGNAIFELNETNNTVVDDQPVSLPVSLGLTLSASTISESGGSAVLGTVSRNSDTSSPLVVTLSSSDPTAATAPATVTIPAGQSSTSFHVTAVGDSRVDGTQATTIGVAAAGFAGASQSLDVTDDDLPALTLQVASSDVSEAGGNGVTTGTINRNTPTSGPLTVSLLSSEPARIRVPATVTIPAGQASTTFSVDALNNALIEGPLDMSISAAAQGFTDGSVVVDITDDDLPAITVAIDADAVSEGSANPATTATVTRAVATPTPVLVALISSDPDSLRAPLFVTIPANQTSTSFALTAVNNTQVDGARTVTIAAYVANPGNNKRIESTRVTDTAVVADDDGPTLGVTLNVDVVSEAGTATGTVRRNTPTTSALLVALFSSDTTEARVPASVIIPAGQAAATFTVSGVADGVVDGTHAVTVSASANGFNPGSDVLSVSDSDLPDLRVANLAVPPTAATGATVSATWDVANNGIAPATGNWIDRVYLSNDAAWDDQDTLLGEFPHGGPLAVGATYPGTRTFKIPDTVAPVRVIVKTDADGAVGEGVEGNNITVSDVINVTPEYRATVETDVVTANQGAPIPLRGRAFHPGDNSPAPFRFVTISVRVNNTRREITAFTKSDGTFTAVFQPLPNEGGLYTIGADFPGMPTDPSQDQFSIIGMRAEPPQVSLRMSPGTPLSGQVTLRNNSPVPLTGLVATVVGAPATLQVNASVATTLPGSGSIPLSYTLSTSDATLGTGRVILRLTSAEGVGLDVPLDLIVVPLVPQLVANPGSVSAGVLRGDRTLVSFDFTNIGGAPSGSLDVLLPSLPWMTLAGEARIPSLAPGAKATVTLALNPANDLPLGLYNGAVVLQGGTVSLNVPFQVRVVSAALGDLYVSVLDDYTFYVEGSPKVAGASVRLSDPYSGATVASGTTGDNGEVTLLNVPEGEYSLTVTASKHGVYRAAATIVPGVTSSTEVFIERQMVSYNWTVVPTEVQDNYKITLESTFETNVPIPVVTVDPPFRMLLATPGQDTQFNLTLTNQGLIAAQGVKIVLPQSPDWELRALVDEIGVLPAKSSVTVPILIRPRQTALSLQQLRIEREKQVEDGTMPGMQIAGTNLKIDPGIPCVDGLKIDTYYYYTCGPNNVYQQASADLTPICVAQDVYACIKQALESIGSSLPSLGGALTDAPCAILDVILQCADTGLSDCQKALITAACKGITGALTGGLAGAAGGVGSAAGGLLGCLCGLLDYIPPLPSSVPSGGGGGGFGGGGLVIKATNGFPYGGLQSFIIPVNTCSTPSAAAAGAGSGMAGVSSVHPADTAADLGVCARVKISIEQRAVLTRQAFLGTFEIENGHTDESLDDVQVILDIRDHDGNAVTDKLVIRSTEFSGLAAVDGTGSIAPGATGTARYTFLPTRSAAPDEPELYSIGGTLRYMDNGVEVVVPLLPAYITVLPDPNLVLHYFQQRDVYSDDPFTSEVEPAEPFDLGVMVTNTGKGLAHDFHITSAQPRIIENEKGLLIDFKIIGTQVNDQPTAPTLKADFGDLDPGETGVGRWRMTSTLQGKFLDYSAKFEHTDAIGNANVSLIDSVDIHELIHTVLADRAADDLKYDFLTNDVPDPAHAPDTLWLSNGTTAVVNAATSAATDGPVTNADREVHLTANMTSGWNYLELPDPGPGFRLARVVRSDGKEIKVGDNAWTTDRTFPESSTGARREHTFHLLDFNGTGLYTLTYMVDDSVPPTVVGVQAVDSPRVAPLSTVDVTFSEEIDLATFDFHDVSLTLNGGSNLVTGSSGVGVTRVTGTPATYRISGLDALTGADGNYVLTVNGAGVQDYGGNAATNSGSTAWAKGAVAPVVVSLGPVSPDPRNTGVSTLDVVFSRAVDPATFTPADLTLTRDGGPNLITDAVTVTQLSGSTFRIGGLGAATAAEGSYELRLDATGVQAPDTTAGAGTAVESWSVDTTAPALTSIEQVVTTPRNIVVPGLDVTFSQPINPATFDWHDVTLTRNGGPNLVTSQVIVTRVSDTVYRLSEFNWVSGLEGTYFLSVAGAGIQDPAGNAATGSASATWVMDTTKPAKPTGLAISPDRGASPNDGLTNTGDVTLTGTLGETGLVVRLFDLTTLTDLGEATITGTSFAKALSLPLHGAHRIRVRATDRAGNVSDESIFEAFVDLTPPAATFAPVVPATRQTPVTSVDVELSEAIDESTFTWEDVVLTRDAGFNLATSAVTVTHVTGNTYRIGNLQGLTGAVGNYELSLAPAGVADRAGNLGGGGAVSWERTAADRAPSLDLGAATGTAVEGALFTRTASFSDADLGDFWTASVDWGDGSGAEQIALRADKTFDLNHAFPDNGTYGVTVHIMDAAGATDTKSISVTVANAAPVVVAPADATVRPGSPFAATGSFTDAGARDTWTATVNWGDGSATQPLALNPDHSFALNKSYAAPGTYNVTVTVTDDDGGSASDSVLVTVSRSVVGRNVFYNGSVFDPDPISGAGAAGSADDGAIASDKVALMPGQAATFANYTSYAKGINGIMIDLPRLPADPTAQDFEFRVGNNSTPSGWAAAPAPVSITRRAGAGVGGADRVTIIWADGAIRNTWLQVTVKATPVTGLAAADVFYFGNLQGETGDVTSAGRVSAIDVAGVKRALNLVSEVTGRFDFNRDGRVNALDVAALKQNLNRSLALITTPAALAPVFSAPAPAPSLGAGEVERRQVWTEPASDPLR